MREIGLVLDYTIILMSCMQYRVIRSASGELGNDLLKTDVVLVYLLAATLFILGFKLTGQMDIEFFNFSYALTGTFI